MKGHEGKVVSERSLFKSKVFFHQAAKWWAVQHSYSDTSRNNTQEMGDLHLRPVDSEYATQTDEYRGPGETIAGIRLYR